MEFKIISKLDINPSVWDGGETFQYFIYPADSLYSERNFLFRISSASIKKIPSHFTRFEAFHRFLVMLDNSLEIKRNGKFEKYSADDVFEFSSNDEIVSNSLGNDFNLMVSNRVQFSSVQLADGCNEFSKEFIFVFAKDRSLIRMDEHEIFLNPFDMLSVSNSERNSIQIKSDKMVIVALIDLI